MRFLAYVQSSWTVSIVKVYSVPYHASSHCYNRRILVGSLTFFLAKKFLSLRISQRIWGDFDLSQFITVPGDSSSRFHTAVDTPFIYFYFYIYCTVYFKNSKYK